MSDIKVPDNCATQKRLLWICGIITLIAIIFGLMGPCGKPQKITFTKHDTIYLDRYHRDTLTKFSYVVEPNVTGYKEARDGKNYKYILKNDTFYVMNPTQLDTTLIHDTIKVSSAFLTNWPDKPKLLRNTLNKDSISYDLFYPDGKVWTNTYPLDLDKFSYVWENNQFKAVKVKKPFFKQIHGESYLYTLYEPILSAPKLDLDYALSYKTVALYGRLSGEAKPLAIRFYIGTRVKLK